MQFSLLVGLIYALVYSPIKTPVLVHVIDCENSLLWLVSARCTSFFSQSKHSSVALRVIALVRVSICALRKSNPESNAQNTFNINFSPFFLFDSIIAGTAEKCSVSDVLINSALFLDITRTIVSRFANSATKCSRNLNEMPLFLLAVRQILKQDKTVKWPRSIK